MTDPLVPQDDAGTELIPEEREGLIPSYITLRSELNDAEQANIEAAIERMGGITLDSLERAAHALDCRFVYALVPRESLEAQVRSRARELAKQRLRALSHNMALEDQRVSEDDEQAQLERMIEKLLNAPGSKLWDEL